MKNRKNKKDNEKDKVGEEEKKIVFPPTDQKYDDDYLVNKPKNEL